MMKSRIWLWLTCCLFLWGGGMSALADNNCYLKVKADPEEGAFVSGGGEYVVNGSRVLISTSAKNTEDYVYTFQYWTLDGKKVSTTPSFYYTPTAGNHQFVAHYDKQETEFDPDNPLDPSSTNIRRKFYLYLTSNMEGVCSFSIASGNKVEEKTEMKISVLYESSRYQFEGWKLDGIIISTETSLELTMPSAATTLQACFSEKPSEPEEPSEPSEPEEPEEPDEPDGPSGPDAPDSPSEPDEPSVPDTPSEPDEPSVPDTPSEPDVPDSPSGPDEPDTPSEPDEPSEPSQPEVNDEIEGDANSDGVLDEKDLNAIINHIMGKPQEGDFDANKADINQDGNVNAADVVAFIKLYKK